MKLFKLVFFLIALIFESTTVLAGINNWVDENGIIQFSNMPPDGRRPILAEPYKGEVSESNEQLTPPGDILKRADSAFNSKDYSKALALLKPLAEKGNPRAQNGLGLIYDRGLGVPKNLNEASKWYRKAAEQGYILAQSYLGSMYAKGEGVPKDSTVVLYCSIGYRSEKVAEELRERGFTKVYNLYGSIFEWVNQGLPVVDTTGEQTRKVHTYNAKWGRWVDKKQAEKVW